MSENIVERTVEFKLGNVVYQVERDFVGTVTREELLINKLTEGKNKNLAHKRKGENGGN